MCDVIFIFFFFWGGGVRVFLGLGFRKTSCLEILAGVSVFSEAPQPLAGKMSCALSLEPDTLKSEVPPLLEALDTKAFINPKLSTRSLA